MKFSEAWLREWVDPDLSAEALAEQMTLMGLEIDSIESTLPEISGVVVAEILEAEKHPNADTLRLCKVNYGADETAEIVCGAPNAHAGLKAPLATIGAVLPGGIKIRKTKLRGIQSHGMLCSAAELQLSADADGLLALPDDAPVGQAIEQYLKLDDRVFKVELTPNRGDCLSIRGLARDISARNNLDLNIPAFNPPSRTITEQMDVIVQPESACARYTGCIVSGVDFSGVAAQSPLWLTERLRRSDIRAINPAVDITNYVMLQLGQPMHAFDLDKVTGAIQVRFAKPGERLTLLDGRDVTLDEDVTVIADDTGAIGIAGIMGGLSTAVDHQSKNIFFESALFLPERVAGKAWRLDAHTDSSHRFERGVDPAGQVEALDVACNLLVGLAGGEIGPVTDWSNPQDLPYGDTLLLRRHQIERVLGARIEPDEIESILRRLDVNIDSHAEGWLVTPPAHRYDLRIEEDYIEELARVYGYNRIPRTSNLFRPKFRPVPETTVTLDSLKNLLVSRGYQEVVTYSFVDPAMQQLLLPDSASVALSNPISADMGVMRLTLLPGLLTTLRHNLNRQISDVRIFESGLKYDPQHPEIKQEMVISGLVSGSRYPENWQHSDAKVDFFDIKGDLEALFLRANGVNWSLQRCSRPFLHPGQAADIAVDDRIVGWIGRLHPELQKSLDVPQSALIFEVLADELCHATVPSYHDISRFPSVRRDISVVVSQSVSVGQLEASIRKNGPEFLQKVVTFDVYSGEKVDSGMKSVALGLILQDFSRTLEESEVDTAMQCILDGLNKEVGAILRV